MFGAPGAERVGPSRIDPPAGPRSFTAEQTGAGAERPLVARVYFLALLLVRPPFLGNGFVILAKAGNTMGFPHLSHVRAYHSSAPSSLLLCKCPPEALFCRCEAFTLCSFIHSFPLWDVQNSNYGHRVKCLFETLPSILLALPMVNKKSLELPAKW